MIKLSHISIFLISLVLLASCFGGWSSENAAGLTWYKGETFTMDIPASWKILDSASDSLPSPSAGEIVLSVSSPDIKQGFANNLLILKEIVDANVSSEEFSKMTHLWAKGEYYFYDKTSEKTIDFSDELSSTLYVFEAKYNKNTPSLQFLQTAHVCGTDWYLLTIAVSSTWDSAKYEEILKTFQCK